MREIKFRAWDKNSSKMLDEVYLQDYECAGEFSLCRLNECLAATTLEVMQFTGLHDKNGKEIYEGDILSSEYLRLGSQYDCHPVVWGQGRWDVDHSINGCCKPWRGDLNGHHISEEVFGNIYENPELLKT